MSQPLADQQMIMQPVKQSDTGVGLNGVLGFRVVDLSPDRVVIEWQIGPEHLQSYGMVHGGVMCAAVEAAASHGAAAWMGDRGKCVGVSNHTDFIRAAVSGLAVATATPVHRGRSQQLWLVEVVDEDGRLYSRGQVRFQNLEPRPGPTQLPGSV